MFSSLMLRDLLEEAIREEAMRQSQPRYGLFEDHYFNPPHVHFNVIRPRQPSSSKEVDSKSENNFKVMMNVKHFGPDEIEVKVVDNFVVIHGKHEEHADEHGFVSREFTRRYELPDDVEADKISSSLSKDGVLTIKAPRKMIEPPKNERVVPITIQQPSAVEEAQKLQEQQQQQQQQQQEAEAKE